MLFAVPANAARIGAVLMKQNEIHQRQETRCLNYDQAFRKLDLSTKPPGAAAAAEAMEKQGSDLCTDDPLRGIALIRQAFMRVGEKPPNY